MVFCLMLTLSLTGDYLLSFGRITVRSDLQSGRIEYKHFRLNKNVYRSQQFHFSFSIAF